MSSSKTGESPSEINTNTERVLPKKLHSAFNTTCEKFVSSIRFSRMKKKFAEIYKENPETLKNLHEQLSLQLKRSISEDLDELCKEHGIDFLLNSLEIIKKNQEFSDHSWRPSGNCEEDLRDHIYPLKMKQKEALQAVLTKLMTSNEELINFATVNHAEILHIKKSNDDLFERFNTITSSIKGSSMQNLQDILEQNME